MDNALLTRMSTDDFLAWEIGQELKWEFDGFGPVAMNGGTRAHSMIQMNLAASLVTRLRGGPCTALGSDMKVRIGSKIRYPDAHVTCTADLPSATVAQNPVVIFEVLSESTGRTDRTSKLLEYRSLGSVQRYVLIEQDQAMATSFARIGEGWVVDQFLASDTLAMPEIGIEIPISELYADVELPEDAA